jgi:ANTAR domain
VAAAVLDDRDGAQAAASRQEALRMTFSRPGRVWGLIAGQLRDQVMGALNLFRAEAGALDAGDVRIGQGLADVATISVLHERGMRQSDSLNEQLETALNSRVVIEQAKGKLAERLGLDMDQAFGLLRDYARDRNLRLAELAQSFVDGTESLSGPAVVKSMRRPPPAGRSHHQERPGPKPRQ